MLCLRETDVSIAFEDQNCFALAGFLFRNDEGLQICPNINIAAGGNLCRAKENVPAVATRAANFYRVLSAVSCGAVKGHRAALVAVGRVDWPCGLVPSAFKVVADLGEREREGSKREKSSLVEHGCEYKAEANKNTTLVEVNLRIGRGRGFYVLS